MACDDLQHMYLSLLCSLQIINISYICSIFIFKFLDFKYLYCQAIIMRNLNPYNKEKQCFMSANLLL